VATHIPMSEPRDVLTKFSTENTWHVQLFIGIKQIATKIFCY